MILSLRQLKLLVTATVAISATSANWVMAGTFPVKGSSPKLLSAFFGLDNALPLAVNLLCFGASVMTACQLFFHTASAATRYGQSKFKSPLVQAN